MDGMSISGGMSAGAMVSSLQQQALGAQLIDNTLQKLNTTAGVAMEPRLNPNFELQSAVLNSAYTGKGTMLDISV